MDINNLRIAIFYDWLNQWGGAEKVLSDILKVFPEASVYTLLYHPQKTNWLPKNTVVYPSKLNRFSLTKKNNLLHTPFYAVSLEQFDFSQYDIVISTTSIIGHCLLTPPKTLFICYFHNTNRYLYQTPPQFKLIQPLLKKYQRTDFIYGQRPDFLLCNSKTVQERIKKNYHRHADIIYPGVDTSFFIPKSNESIEPYFLTVSRLVNHKRVDLAIQACQELNQKLIIVGEGRDYHRFLKLKTNKSKIVFMGKVSNKKLLSLYQNCQALICPQIEDFGLTSLEAQACGKPVIAFNQGGLTETIIENKTGIFFPRQTVKSLVNAIARFDPQKFDSTDCVSNAKRFSQTNFMLNFKQIVTQLWQQHQNTLS